MLVRCLAVFFYILIAFWWHFGSVLAVFDSVFQSLKKLLTVPDSHDPWVCRLKIGLQTPFTCNQELENYLIK